MKLVKSQTLAGEKSELWLENFFGFMCSLTDDEQPANENELVLSKILGSLESAVQSWRGEED